MVVGVVLVVGGGCWVVGLVARSEGKRDQSGQLRRNCCRQPPRGHRPRCKTLASERTV